MKFSLAESKSSWDGSEESRQLGQGERERKRERERERERAHKHRGRGVEIEREGRGEERFFGRCLGCSSWCM